MSKIAMPIILLGLFSVLAGCGDSEEPVKATTTPFVEEKSESPQITQEDTLRSEEPINMTSAHSPAVLDGIQKVSEPKLDLPSTDGTKKF